MDRRFFFPAWVDRQTLPPTGRCRDCGVELYGPEPPELCPDCAAGRAPWRA